MLYYHPTIEILSYNGEIKIIVVIYQQLSLDIQNPSLYYPFLD